jgi:hypothetical protein
MGARAKIPTRCRAFQATPWTSTAQRPRRAPMPDGQTGQTTRVDDAGSTPAPTLASPPADTADAGDLARSAPRRTLHGGSRSAHHRRSLRLPGVCCGPGRMQRRRLFQHLPGGHDLPGEPMPRLVLVRCRLRHGPLLQRTRKQTARQRARRLRRLPMVCADLHPRAGVAYRGGHTCVCHPHSHLERRRGNSRHGCRGLPGALAPMW